MSNRLLQWAMALTIAGLLVVLALLVRETPWTLTAFMFLGQPLLALGFVLFVWRVVRDLRRTGLF